MFIVLNLNLSVHGIMNFVFSIFTIYLSLTCFEPSFQPWGADAELVGIKSETIEDQKSKPHLGERACSKMIRFFQEYISPIDGPRSSFYPTSSQYALEAIQKYGVFTGIALGCDRLLRENGEVWVYERTDDYGMQRKLDPVR